MTFEPPGEAGEGLVQLLNKPLGGLEHDIRAYMPNSHWIKAA